MSREEPRFAKIRQHSREETDVPNVLSNVRDSMKKYWSSTILKMVLPISRLHTLKEKTVTARSAAGGGGTQDAATPGGGGLVVA